MTTRRRFGGAAGDCDCSQLAIVTTASWPAENGIKLFKKCFKKMVSVLGGSAGYSDSSQLATVTVASWLLSQSPATRPNYLKHVF